MYIIDANQAINEANARAGIDAPTTDLQRGLLPPKRSIEHTFPILTFRPPLRYVPPNKIEETIAQRTRDRAWPNDRLLDAHAPVKDQGQTNYCWAHSLASACECARLIDPQPWIELAPESIGGSVNWKNQGNTLEDAIGYAAKHGFAPRAFVENNVLDPKKFTTGWTEAAKNFKPLEWIEIGTADLWNDVVQMLLNGFAIYAGYDWWSHAVTIVALTIVAREICPVILNSWGADWGENGRGVLTGSKRVPAWGCYALCTLPYYTTRSELKGPATW